MRGSIDPGEHRFRPRLIGLQMHGRIPDPGMAPYPPRVALALRTLGWGFNTVRSGIDPGDYGFRPQFVGVIVHVWKDL